MGDFSHSLPFVSQGVQGFKDVAISKGGVLDDFYCLTSGLTRMRLKNGAPVSPVMRKRR